MPGLTSFELKYMKGTMAKHERRAKPASAPMCEVTGHQWQHTTSDKIERCSRKTCKKVKFLVHGHWKYFDYSRKTSVKNLIEAQQLQEQLTLWDIEEGLV